MSRRVLIVLVALGVLATGGGVAGGLLLARDPGPDPAVAGPTTLPETTVPETTEPATSTSTSSSSTSSSSTSTAAGLSLQARVLERLEDGVVVGYDASEPVTAVLSWGFGAPDGSRLQFPGPAAQGSLKLALEETRVVSMRVIGQAADGRTGSSGTLRARRLVRRVVLEVQQLELAIDGGTGGIATGFRGTSYTPIGPAAPAPSASAGPYAFPSSVLGPGVRSSPMTLRFFHRVPPGQQQSQAVTLTVPLPRSGASTLTREVSSAIGVTASLNLKVTVTVS